MMAILDIVAMIKSILHLYSNHLIAYPLQILHCSRIGIETHTLGSSSLTPDQHNATPLICNNSVKTVFQNLPLKTMQKHFQNNDKSSPFILSVSSRIKWLCFRYTGFVASGARGSLTSFTLYIYPVSTTADSINDAITP